MANVKFLKTGDSIDYTPELAVSAGDVVVANDLVGVAKLDIAAGTLGALAVTGEFEFPKAPGSASAMAFGIKAYWDAILEVATADADGGANPYLGKVSAGAGDDALRVRIRMSQ
jgi:predicted RecA/RadA family phage recombinase